MPCRVSLPAPSLAAAALLLGCFAATLSAQDSAGDTRSTYPAVRGVVAIAMTVSDLDRAVSFFTSALTFEKVSETGLAGEAFGHVQGLSAPTARLACLRLGDEFVELIEYVSPKGRPFPADSRSNDRWFQHVAIIVSDMERAHARLLVHGVRPASRGGPQRLPDWNRAAAGIKAFYFRDPDGHFLEVLEFPPGKGNPRWHRRDVEGGPNRGIRDEPIFLGIDHTAIVVADTESSLRFYRDALGFQVVGGSENHGVQQENLNNVPGAHLRITTLRTAAGPAIELLEYLHPRDGRAYPADARTNDVLHWQTTIVARNVAEVAGRLREQGSRFVSDGVVQWDGQSEGWRAFLVRDPDGHALKIVGE
jgi:catechol 2,3-dioxygenase-like lactoylglutathione lyase family enzyme